jgi:hypothetical protein
MDNPQPNEKRIRSPGKRYPGASLLEVIDLIRAVDANGGDISTGLLASRLGGVSEGGSPFKRLLASARSYGLADYDEKNNALVRLTESGQSAISTDGERSREALRQAFVLPEMFQVVARNLAGKQLPALDGLIDRFTNAGVAPSGAQLAAENFLASAAAAGAVTEEGERRILDADLPFPATAVATPIRPASTRTPAAVPSKIAGTAGGPKVKLDPLSKQNTQSGVGLTVRLDVSGWEVDKVVELIEKLRSGG